MQVFAGSASKKLGQEVAKIIGAKYGEIELSKFANGETKIRILEPKIESSVVVLQSLSHPSDNNLMELLLIVDALTRMGARDITLVVPWLSYSKQDKVFLPGEALGVKVVAKILQTSGVKRLITFDLHNRAILGFFDIPVTELSAKPLLLGYFAKNLNESSRNETLIVAPDAGAVKAATSFAQELGVQVVYVDKKRDLKTGEVSVMGLSRSVSGMNIIIIDDNVFTGSTIIELAKELKNKGARKISVGLTHHMYIDGVQQKLDESYIDEIVVSDTVTPNAEILDSTKKLKVLSIASIIGNSLT